MNSSHERGQGKCAFADEFQTLIKRCLSGLVCLQSEAIFGQDLRHCLHAHLMTACIFLVLICVCYVCVCFILLSGVMYNHAKPEVMKH